MTRQGNSQPQNGIEVEGLVRSFKDVRAVDGIDISIEPGQIYGFLGPNGAGKSTTVHMLTTLLPPSAGRATVAGYDVQREGAKVRASIGAALQDTALDPFLSGREHLRLQASLHGIRGARRQQLIDTLLGRVGLTSAGDRKIRPSSGGMKRRLDLALALIHDPSTLFLDEPTTGLAPQSRTALWEEVGRLARDEGVTVFLTTQYLEDADVLANRVGIIDKGLIVAEGTPAELKASIGRPGVEAVPGSHDDAVEVGTVMARFGEPIAASRGVAVRLSDGDLRLADIVRALDAEGIEIADITLHAPTLDDVFLAKTERLLEGASNGEVDEMPAHL